MYNQDGLTSVHNHEFMDEPAFVKAYARGVKAAGMDYKWHWRVHVGLWAAYHAAQLDGDFVECGVNKGFMSSAIMEYLDWHHQPRQFYLMDTFSGVDSRFLSAEDVALGVVERNQKDIERGFYTFATDEVMANFAEWRNKQFVVGAIPETLKQVQSRKIAFIHMDLNCSLPEVEALNYFWDSLVPGAIVLLDDYAYVGYESQKIGMDRFAKSKKIQVLSMPTGQGLIIKPH